MERFKEHSKFIRYDMQQKQHPHKKDLHNEIGDKRIGVDAGGEVVLIGWRGFVACRMECIDGRGCRFEGAGLFLVIGLWSRVGCGDRGVE